MNTEEKFYQELLASGISETLASSLCKMAKTRGQKKQKTGNPAAAFYASKSGVETEVIVTYECRVCGSTREYRRTVKGDGEDSTNLVQTCADCAQFLLNKSRTVLIGALVLQNHAEKDFRELPLHNKLSMAKKRSALEWLNTTMSPPRMGSGPDKDDLDDELAPLPEANPEAEAAVRAAILDKLIASGVDENIAELMLEQLAPRKKVSRKRKQLPFQDVIVTKLCRTCNSRVTYKTPMRSLDTEMLTQECSFRICENCIGMFQTMPLEQLVSLLLIQNSRDVELRLLDPVEQIKLAGTTDPIFAYDLTV